MSNRPILALVADILRALEKISRFTDGASRAEFIADERTCDAVVRNLEIIGEASKRLPETFTTRYPTVPWRKIVGLRNRVIHEYFGVDMEIVWTIIQNDLPSFHSALKDIHAQSLRDQE